MSELAPLIEDLAFILVLAGIVTIFCKKFNQPLVLGYILAGFFASPHFNLLPNVVDTANITVWSDIGVIFILFSLGLDFNFAKIKSIGGTALIAAVTELAGITLLDGDGREAAIIRSLDTLIPESRRAVEECLEEFYLIPRITGIYDITDKKGSLSWHVQTDRGERRFSIRNRHSDIKVLYDGRVLVRDSDDNRYEIPSLYELDKKSRAKLKSEI